MKKKGLFTGFVLLLLFSLTSAGAKQEGEDYFPMSDGSRWDYSTEFCAAGNCNEGKLTSLIDGEETINGKKYFKAVTTGDGVPEQKISYNRKSKEGVFGLSGKHKDKPEQLVMPVPLRVGKTWTFQSYEPFLATNETSVVGKETLFLPDKKYDNCLKVSTKGVVEEGELKGTTVEVTTYYAPNIGVVKSLLRDPDNKITFERILTKYEP